MGLTLVIVEVLVVFGLVILSVMANKSKNSNKRK